MQYRRPAKLHVFSTICLVNTGDIASSFQPLGSILAPPVKYICIQLFGDILFHWQLRSETSQLCSVTGVFKFLVLLYIRCRLRIITQSIFGRFQIPPSLHLRGKGFRPFNFDLWVGGGGLDMCQQLNGGFGSKSTILPFWVFGAKNGSKTEI